MFESEFLTSTDESRRAYTRVLTQAAEIVAEAFPRQPYCGKKPIDLADLVEGDPLQPSSWEKLTETMRTVIANSIAVSHPRTAAHLHCPPLLAALAAEVVISALNQSMDSFDQAPSASILEPKLIRWLCSESGLPERADGTFTAGGSQSNYMGLLLARDLAVHKHWNQSAQKAGLPPEGRRLRILCSEVAHFTVEKSAAQLGLGTDSVVRIGVDDDFRMRPELLREALEGLKAKGLLPMAVVATAGTTDFGSVDPLPEIKAMARQADCWLHVDAAYGGALLFSAKHRAKISGIHEADSVTIDFHKLFWQPIPCSALLVRDAKLFDPIKFHADYLNPELHDAEGIPNLVTTSLLTSRRFDALKLWISLQSLGREKLSAMIDHTIALANKAANVIREIPAFQLMCAPQLSTVVFRYVPRAGANADSVNAEIRQTFFDRGEAVIGHTRVRGLQCLKFTCMNPTATDADMKHLIEGIRTCGAEIEDKMVGATSLKSAT